MSEVSSQNITDETKCKFISSRGIAKSCDIYPKNIKSDSSVFNSKEYTIIKEGNSVYVVTDCLKQFIKDILPLLEKQNITIKLVTGCSVQGVPTEISKSHDINYINRICFSPSIVIWFTQNYDLDYESNFIIPIPLGLDYHTLSQKNHVWGKKMTPVGQDFTFQTKISSFDNRKNETFSFFNFTMCTERTQDRHVAKKILLKKKFNTFMKHQMKREKTMELCSKYKFIISPHGNGLDCHRTYEAMCIGSIAVVKSSPLDLLYKDMPIVILREWKDINIDDLLEESISTNLLGEKLELSYWVDLIKKYN